MRPLTLASLALLGLSTTAFGQELDETTSDLGFELEDGENEGKAKRNRSRGSRGNSARRGGGQRGGQQARGNAQRGGSRGAPSARSGPPQQRTSQGPPQAQGRGMVRQNGNFTEGYRQNGDTRQMYRTDGDRTMTRTIQQRGDQTRTRTTGTAPGKTRQMSEITNGNKTVRWGEGTNSYRDAQRTQSNMNISNGRGGTYHQRNEGELARRGPNGTKTIESRVRSNSSNGSHRHAGAATTHNGAHGRPSTHRPTTAHGRPSGHVAGTGHSRPHSTRVVTHGSGHASHVRVAGGGHRHVRYSYVRPYHGVFVYGPPPATHNHYHGNPQVQTRNGQVKVAKSDLPERFVDRDNTLAVGLKGGSLWSGYVGANAYADAGLGLNARYRPDEAVGLDLAIQHHDQTWNPGSERSQTMMSGSVELFAYPWTRVSPYAIGGLTYTTRNIEDEIFQFDGINNIETRQPLVGPHVGLGVEFALGKSVALDLEARYTGYLNRDISDASLPGALTTTAGLMFHF